MLCVVSGGALSSKLEPGVGMKTVVLALLLAVGSADWEACENYEFATCLSQGSFPALEPVLSAGEPLQFKCANSQRQCERTLVDGQSCCN